MLLPRRGVGEALLQTVAHRGERRVLLAASRLQRVELVQRGQRAVRWHGHRLVQHHDAEVVEEERVRVVLRMRVRRASDVAGEGIARCRGVPVSQSASNQISTWAAGARCNAPRSGTASAKAACRCSATADSRLHPARPSSPTYGWPLPSSSPLVMAAADPAPSATTAASVSVDSVLRQFIVLSSVISRFRIDDATRASHGTRHADGQATNCPSSDGTRCATYSVKSTRCRLQSTRIGTDCSAMRRGRREARKVESDPTSRSGAATRAAGSGTSTTA